jgi:hypothetical protein
MAASGLKEAMGDKLPASAFNAYVDSFKKGEPMSLDDLFVLAREQK